MQAVQALSMPYADGIDSSALILTPIHWLGHIFGCWHQKMNRPYTRNNETYRTCMSCGARRRFNVGRYKMTGPYYYAPPSALYDSPSPIRSSSAGKELVSERAMGRWADDGGTAPIAFVRKGAGDER